MLRLHQLALEEVFLDIKIYKLNSIKCNLANTENILFKIFVQFNKMLKMLTNFALWILNLFLCLLITTSDFFVEEF